MKVTASLKRVIYQNEKNWGIYIFSIKDSFKDIKVTGVINKPVKGVNFSLDLESISNNEYGDQYKINSIILETDLNDPAQILAVLSSGLIPGVREKMALTLLKEFREDIGDIIKDHPMELTRIKGITKKKALLIQEAWINIEVNSHYLSILIAKGFTKNRAQFICENHDQPFIESALLNPYEFTKVKGIGFRLIDELAVANFKIERDCIHRIRSGIKCALKESQTNGSFYINVIDLTNRTTELFKGDFSFDDIFIKIKQMAKEDNLLHHCKVDGEVYLCFPKDRELEIKLAQEIERLKEEIEIDYSKANEAMAQAIDDIGYPLDEIQKIAILKSLGNRISIITGGPGRGKTTVARTLIETLENLEGNKVTYLNALSAKAAKKIGESCQRDSSTLHSLLRIGGDESAEINLGTIHGDLFIIDESSMVGSSLFYTYLSVIPSTARVVILGDPDQLQSIDCGNVLRDLISSGKIPVTTLEKIYRVKNGSENIIISSDKVIQGEIPTIEDFDQSIVSQSVGFLKTDDVKNICDIFLSYERRRIDSQILSPYKKGELGTENINKIIQARYFSHLGDDCFMSKKHKDKRFYIGDRVIQTQNTRYSDIYLCNGSIGVVIDYLYKKDGTIKGIIVEFDDIIVEIISPTHIELAYATTVHKAQGNEYSCVLMAVSKAHYHLMSRELLYTGMTRAKEKLILFGDKRALSLYCIKENQKRISFLKEEILKLVS
jgi:exodeoxyribonuclease V alpha subunit